MMRGLGSRVTKRWGAWVLLLTFLSFNISCFSDRDATSPIDQDGDCRMPLTAIGPNKVVVAIHNFTFFPDTVRVRPGTEVVWVNCETTVPDYHTSTSSTGAWNSGALNRGEVYARAFAARGQFGYFCEPHPFMRGAVIVE